MASNRKVISVLDRLIAASRDSEKGYNSAAHDVSSPELKKLFDSYLKERNRFTTELLEEVHRLDQPAERSGSWLGDVHRGWLNVMAALRQQYAGVVINECERSERSAARVYVQALKKSLPPEVRSLIEKQYARIQEAQARLRTLEVIAVLDPLIAACKDAENGYRSAAADVCPQEEKETLLAIAKERAEFADELIAEVRRLGDIAEKEGTWLGTLHRAWMQTRATLQPSDRPVLEECARGDRAASRKYKKAMTHALPETVGELVKKQHAKIEETARRVSARTVTV